jgi:hypothetical protein
MALMPPIASLHAINMPAVVRQLIVIFYLLVKYSLQRMGSY